MGRVYRKTEEQNAEKFEAEPDNIRRRKGASIGSQLLGEAYVESVINVEVAGDMA